MTRVGIDSVSSSEQEWARFAQVTRATVVGSYINGRFANSGVAKHALPDRTHVVYDVFGDRPDADILDIEPFDASPSDGPSWVSRYFAQKGNRVLSTAGLYCSASTINEVVHDLGTRLNKAAKLTAHVSDLLDAGFARHQVIIQSAHYGKGAHICGPDSCGFPQADATQYADKGPNGENVDLTIWTDECFLQPRKDPDARYDLFDNVRRTLIGRNTERATVMEYDKWRRTQTHTKHPHRMRLALLRRRLHLLAGRLQKVVRQADKPSNTQIWRLHELRDRANGRRLV